MAILPTGMPFSKWACALRDEYPDSQFPIIISENHWILFANSIIVEPAFNNIAPLDPRGFNDWRSWAIRFTEIIGA